MIGAINLVCSFAFASAGPITLSVIAASNPSWSSYKYGSRTHGNPPYSYRLFLTAPHFIQQRTSRSR